MGFWLFHSWLETGCLIAFRYPTGTSQKGVFSIFISSPFFTVWKTERERERRNSGQSRHSGTISCFDYYCFQVFAWSVIPIYVGSFTNICREMCAYDPQNGTRHLVCLLLYLL